jgi:hypothetical protein
MRASVRPRATITEMNAKAKQPTGKRDLKGLTLELSSAALAKSAKKSLAAHRQEFHLTPAERGRLRRTDKQS